MNAPRRPIDSLSPARFPDLPPDFVVRAALKLRGAVRRLADALLPADVALFERITGISATVLVGTAAKLGIADLLDDGPMSAEELAKACRVAPDPLHRTLRALATDGVFRLRPDGRFENNRLSRALRSGELHHTNAFAGYFASASNLHAWSDFPNTVVDGRGAFRRVHAMSVWEWFDAHPEEREQFALAMMGISTRDAPVVAKLYPFREIRRICDVGGGRGTLLSELLLRHPHLEGVLCDAPGVLESAKRLLAERGVEARVTLAAGSFFERVPEGCDAYVLKNVLHDWDDEASRRILGIVRQAMQPGARLLVVEMLVDRHRAEGYGPFSDLQMMVVCDDGRERSLPEFQKLFESSGFRFTRTFGSATVSVLEALAV